jgi:queuine tRNA-ribosyltransferase
VTTNPGSFEIIKNSSNTSARLARLTTARGELNTPVFMPVGTQATVKTLSNRELEETGAQIILANSFHLYLRPGTELITEAGGLHKFMGWEKPMLTDSGGFQIFSLAKLRKIGDDGVEFRSHLDGSKHFISPESSMDIQRAIGADIIMCFDECLAYPSTHELTAVSMKKSAAWAKRCKERFSENECAYGKKQLLFGIIQGSTFSDLRLESADLMKEIGFPGYAIGGLSVGEPKEEMLKVLEALHPALPKDKPRYLMGVGMPEDIWECVERGVDMFDCVLPTRNGRNGQAFTSTGKVNIKNAEYIRDFGPLDKECSCYTCRTHSRAYLNHLFRAQELLVLRLLSLHNIYFMIELTNKIRKSLEQDRFAEAKKKFFEKYEI